MLHLHVTPVWLNDLNVTCTQRFLRWNYFISSPSFPDWKQFSRCQTPPSALNCDRRSVGSYRQGLLDKLLIMGHKTWVGVARGKERTGVDQTADLHMEVDWKKPMWNERLPRNEFPWGGFSHAVKADLLKWLQTSEHQTLFYVMDEGIFKQLLLFRWEKNKPKLEMIFKE